MDKFEDIEARRIKIVGDDGVVRMVLTAPPTPDATLRGERITEQNRQEASILFYNDEGTECGGLSFSGRTGPEGIIEASVNLAFDQYEQDQVLSLSFSQHGEERGYGLSMNDRPLVSIQESLEEQQRVASISDDREKEAALQEIREQHAQRLFLGRLPTGEMCLYMMDSKGRARIRIAVDSQDVPKMEFFDEGGAVIYSVPPSA